MTAVSVVDLKSVEQGNYSNSSYTQKGSNRFTIVLRYAGPRWNMTGETAEELVQPQGSAGLDA